MFYITDKSMDHSLNSHLLDARKRFSWISKRESSMLPSAMQCKVGIRPCMTTCLSPDTVPENVPHEGSNPTFDDWPNVN
jgi:hypothetical protein